MATDDICGDGDAAVRRLSQLIDQARLEVERLTQARRALIIDLHNAGYTQNRLAQSAAVTQPYINRIIKGGRPNEPVTGQNAQNMARFASSGGQLADLGSRIALARERAGMSATDVARVAGVPAQTVDLLEAGADVAVSAFLRIAAALGKSGWLADLELLEPTPMERLNAIMAGNPLPVDAASSYAGQFQS